MKTTSRVFPFFLVGACGCGAAYPVDQEVDYAETTAALASYAIGSDTASDVDSCREGRQGPGGCVNQFIKFSAGGSYLRGGAPGVRVTQALNNINDPDLRWDFVPYHFGTFKIKKTGSDVCMQGGTPPDNKIYMGFCDSVSCVKGGHDVCEWKFTGGNNPYSGYTVIRNMGLGSDQTPQCIESDLGASFVTSSQFPVFKQCVSVVNNSTAYNQLALNVDYAPVPESCIAPVISRFPLDGADGANWMINNYVDVARGDSSIEDYTGVTGNEARTYDQHGGMDIDLPSFRQMDSGAANVFSATAGLVIAVRNNSPNDRETSKCTSSTPQRFPNFVVVLDHNNCTVVYLHFRNNSVPNFVPWSTRVNVGDFLGVAGSSGCSTAPHLHFEVDEPDGRPVESVPSMWTSPPAYNSLAGIMDVMLRSGDPPTPAQVKDPAPNPATIAIGGTIGIGFSASLRGNDTLDFDVRSPNNALFATRHFYDFSDARLRHIFGNVPAVTLSSMRGTWKIEAKLNGVPQPARTTTFTM
jgi:murein DD-endopeptidase MepM/ murein hydrolase activator NlpD